MVFLSDSPQKWYNTFDDTVKELRWTPMLWDSGLRRGDSQLCGIMGVHVEDVLLGGRGDLFEKTVAQLKTKFLFGSG